MSFSSPSPNKSEDEDMSIASEGHVIDLWLINLKDPHIQII